jgi:hypothetical protein
VNAPPGRRSPGAAISRATATSTQQADEANTNPTLAVQRKPADTLNVFAHGYYVVGTRGRCRLVLVVARCPWCGRPHAHNGKPDFITGKRTASCHEGRYVVHLGTVAGSVAA